MRNIHEIEEPANEDEEIRFIFIVNGFVPEFSNGLAFRKDKSYKNRLVKDVVCPYCGNYFEQIDVNIKVKVFRYTKKTVVDYHTARPCKVCHKTVAIRYTI
jgi:hypothetical protein